MKRVIYICIVAILLPLGGFAEERNDYMVRCLAFYNLENLFDTIHDEGKNDYEYLPDGGMHWTGYKYVNKVKNMAYALAQLGKDEDPRGAACIGVCEVENFGCLKDVAEKMKEYGRNMVPILLEGPDRRGVDVGFLYDPDMFKVTNIHGYELNGHYGNGREIKSRLQLLISGYLLEGAGKPEKIHIIVNHWPSKFGGAQVSNVARDTAAILCRQICDSIYERDPRAKVVIMGDLNCEPWEDATAKTMDAKMKRKDVGPRGYFNTFWQKLEDGTGSICYNGVWSLFDQHIITEPLLNEDIESGKWVYWKSQIFNKPFLTVQEGRDKGNPLRTHRTGVWQNGYGDHFPTMIYLIKKKQK